MYVLSIVVCPFILFLLILVLSVLLRYTVYVCPFGIFKLFLGISSAPFDKYYNEHKSVKNCTLIKRFNGILNNTGALCTSFVLSQFFFKVSK
jgi:hypothetical protein